jgi:hypothetical protein
MKGILKIGELNQCVLLWAADRWLWPDCQHFGASLDEIQRASGRNATLG